MSDEIVENSENGARESEESGAFLEETSSEKVTDDSMLHGLVEALLIAHGEPLATERLLQISGASEEELRRVVSQLTEKYSDENSGIFLAQVGNSYQIRTKPQFAHYLRQLRAELPRRLSPPALETLAIVAYRQPIVRSDIEKIRGVDAAPTIKTLLERGLIKILGHQSTVGQPALYGTTDEFLKLFGLSSLGELPTLRDLQEIDQAVREEASIDDASPSENEILDSSGADSEPQLPQ